MLSRGGSAPQLPLPSVVGLPRHVARRAEPRRLVGGFTLARRRAWARGTRRPAFFALHRTGARRVRGGDADARARAHVQDARRAAGIDDLRHQLPQGRLAIRQHPLHDAHPGAHDKGRALLGGCPAPARLCPRRERAALATRRLEGARRRPQPRSAGGLRWPSALVPAEPAVAADAGALRLVRHFVAAHRAVCAQQRRLGRDDRLPALRIPGARRVVPGAHAVLQDRHAVQDAGILLRRHARAYDCQAQRSRQHSPLFRRIVVERRHAARAAPLVHDGAPLDYGGLLLAPAALCAAAQTGRARLGRGGQRVDGRHLERRQGGRHAQDQRAAAGLAVGVRPAADRGAADRSRPSFHRPAAHAQRF
mmetsp:Transcript_13792/g.29075  ORF Transcript_13792/g.29075 Transcript_13792/m.29075 type:complete len:364 (+) Transcript_13792:1411-2502(+)